jgi:hypothetical protein
MIVFENEFSAIIRQTQTIYDCNRLPSLCSNLRRPFDPLKDYSGRGQYHAVTKDDPSPAKTRSKILYGILDSYRIWLVATKIGL